MGNPLPPDVPKPWEAPDSPRRQPMPSLRMVSGPASSQQLAPPPPQALPADSGRAVPPPPQVASIPASNQPCVFNLSPVKPPPPPPPAPKAQPAPKPPPDAYSKQTALPPPVLLKAAPQWPTPPQSIPASSQQPIPPSRVKAPPARLVDEMKQLRTGMARWVQEQDAKTAEAKRVAAQSARAKQAAQVDRAERAAEQAAEQVARMKRAEAQLREATAEAKQAAEAAKAAQLAAKAAVEARAAAIRARTWGEVCNESWEQWAAGSAASSQTWVPVPSELLKVWLKNHGLRTVYDKDAYGWTALHHAALESVDHEDGATIFKELMRFEWQATCGFIHSQFVSSCPDSRGSRSELIWVCSLIGFQPDRLSA